MAKTIFTIAESVTLPSKGKLYSKPVDCEISLSAMTTEDEMRRTSPTGTRPLKTLCEIIEKHMLEKPAIPVYDMCVGDYEFLLHRLRIVTYGSKYGVTMKCDNPRCNHVIDTSMDLNDLLVKEFDEEVYNELSTIKLTDGRIISLKYQTPRMIEDVEAEIKLKQAKFPNSDLNWGYVLKLCSQIDLVDGEVMSKDNLERLVTRLSAKDARLIELAEDKLNKYIGIDTAFVVDCPYCGKPLLGFFRGGPEFFRPTVF